MQIIRDREERFIPAFPIFFKLFLFIGTPVLPLWQRVHLKQSFVTPTTTTTTTGGDIESSRQREATEKVHLLLLLHAARRGGSLKQTPIPSTFCARMGVRAGRRNCFRVTKYYPLSLRSGRAGGCDLHFHERSIRYVKVARA